MRFRQILTASLSKVHSTMDRATGPFRWIWPRFPEAVIGLCAIGVVLFVLLTYSTTLARSTSELFAGNKYLSLVAGYTNPFRTRHVLTETDLPIYDLKISHQDFAAMEKVVEKAKKQGWMSEDMRVWVNGTFFCDGEKYNVKVRVRGDLPNHWDSPKKSWAIKFGKQKIEHDGESHKEDIFFRGKRRINLIIPIDRDYAVAPFVNTLMREAGLVVPRDQFVVLRINGSLQGVYYEVEDFDKPLLASQGRPETPVYSHSDRTMHFEQYTKYGTPMASDAKFDIGCVARDIDGLSEYGTRAIEVLLEHSRNPTRENFDRARAVLDWDRFQHFRVLTTLFNTNHVRFGSDNLKLFYDPSRGLLEPIPWDVHIVRLPNEPATVDYFNSKGPDELQRATLTDPELRFLRNKMLWAHVDDGGDRLISKFTKMHDEIRPLVWADVLSTPIQGHRMDLLKKTFEHNVRRAHKVLSSSSANMTYRLEAKDRAVLEIAATNFSGILLKEIQLADPVFAGQSYQLFEDSNHNGRLDPDDPLVVETTAADRLIRLELNRHVFPEVKYGGDEIDGRYWEYFDTLTGRVRYFLVGTLAPEERHPLEWNRPEIQVSALNAVSASPMVSVLLHTGESIPSDQLAITAYNAMDFFDLEAPRRTLDEFLAAYPQFRASQEQPGAAELEGNVKISGTVVVPHGVPLILRPGTDVQMAAEASILCYGGLEAVGTVDDRIGIHGDGSGRPWGAIAAVRPPETVVMKYVDIQDGGQAHLNGILLTGGFAVHDGNLHLENCRIANMLSEDGFNLKNGRLFMSDCLISGNASDGVDIDFGIGEVRNCRFVHNGNDGLDMSGSKLTVSNCRFENNGDKGISVGENSHPVIVNNLFYGNQIGMSIKDLSHAKVAHVTFVANRLAVEAKRKKPFFGGSSAEFINCVFCENHVLLDEDYFSNGGIKLASSLADEPVDFPRCRVGRIQFRSSERGDYSLAPETMKQFNFEPATAAWLELDANGDSAGMPGIFTLPPSISAAIE